MIRYFQPFFNIHCISTHIKSSTTSNETFAYNVQDVAAFNQVLDGLPDDFQFVHAPAYDREECKAVMDRIMDYDVCRWGLLPERVELLHENFGLASPCTIDA